MKSELIPIISIVIPVYNSELYLKRCLDSVLSESLKSKEIIIVNDMSTDHSEEIILQYAKHYCQIKYLTMKSKGFAGGSRNLALKTARGKYIGFLDSDDWVDTCMYKKIVSAMERSSADIGVCGVLREYESRYEVTHRYVYEIENVLEGRYAFDILCKRYNQDVSISSIVCNKVYRAEFLKRYELSFLVKNSNEDDVFNFICFLNAAKVVITPNTYYHYYQRWNSITHSFSKKNLDDLIVAFATIKQYLVNNDIYKAFSNHFYSFFEKTFSFVLEMLITSEPNNIRQNEYIKYFISKCNCVFTISDYIEYFGAKRLRNILIDPTIR